MSVRTVAHQSFSNPLKLHRANRQCSYSRFVGFTMAFIDTRRMSLCRLLKLAICCAAFSCSVGQSDGICGQTELQLSVCPIYEAV